MLGKKPQPLIGKISELLVSGGRAAVLFDALGSPRSPFDMMNLKMQSPKGLKSYDLGGVGLGIVVALDKSSSEEQGHVCTSNSNRSVPIPVTNQRGFQKGVNEIPAGSSEDYTFVTYHVPNNKTITKVYYDGGEGGILTHGYYNINNNNNNNVGVGGVRRIPPTQTLIEEDEQSYPTSDFLSSCHLCRKNLDGKDIYMYRYFEIQISKSFFAQNLIILFIIYSIFFSYRQSFKKRFATMIYTATHLISTKAMKQIFKTLVMGFNLD